MKFQKFLFGTQSKEQLATCDEKLVRVATRALEMGIIDFRVLQGARTDNQQDRLFFEGKTKVRAGQSKHNVGLKSGREVSHAIDVVPVTPVQWEDLERFAVLAGVFFASAKLEGVELRWGGDWDGDTQTKDETFRDSGHFELMV